MAVDFKAKQLEFTAYIRDPLKYQAPADVKKPRIEMYRELIFNNIESFLADNFPVLKKILSAESWQSLVQDFFSTHISKTPYFAEIAEEFLDYLENERNHPADLPFMLELAHYEWVEMALSIAKQELPESLPSRQPLLDQRVQLSPLAWPLAYQYPVHRIAPSFIPECLPDQPSFLIAYRDAFYNVNFIEIAPLTFRLLQVIQENQAMTVKDCLRQVVQESNHPNPDLVMAHGLQALHELIEKTVIVN
jgi:hypothetical protein